MDPVKVLKERGGVATTAQLQRFCTAREVRAALVAGRLVRLRRGALALPSAHDARRAAAKLRGTVTHLSAAQLHGWEVLRPPEYPWVAVPRTRRVTAEDQAEVVVVWSTAGGEVTDPLRTVIDCARRLPFFEGLAVADSALRAGDVTQDELLEAAGRVRGRGAATVRRVAREATPLAGSALESGLRGLGLDVPGLSLEPQAAIDLPGFTVHPDLVDRRRRLVIEAEGWTYHAQKETFARDVERYTLLALDEWRIVRFWTDQIRARPHKVRGHLETLVEIGSRRRTCWCAA